MKNKEYAYEILWMTAGILLLIGIGLGFILFADAPDFTQEHECKEIVESLGYTVNDDEYYKLIVKCNIE